MSEVVDESSPWERGDIPVRREPLEISWDAADVPDEPDDVTSRPRRSDRWLLGGLAAAVILVAAVVVWPRGDGGTAEEPGPTLDSLPDVEESVDGDENDEADDEAIGDLPDAPGDEPLVVGAPASLTDPLPPAVAAITTPTEIVVRTFDGRLHTLSLPSGVVRSTDLGITNGFGGSGNLVTTDEATLIGAFDQGTFLVPRTGVPVRLDPEAFGTTSMSTGGGQVNPYGYVDREDGTSAFLVAVYDPELNARNDFFVDAAGRVSPARNAFTTPFAEPVRAWGEQIVNEAGGVYRIDESSVVRISTGSVIGSSRNGLLVRTCDENLVCAAAIVDFDGATLRSVEIPDGITRTFGLSLSPDGTAMTYSSFGPTNEQVVVDFDGTTTRVPVGGFGGSVWTEDGTGLIAAAPDSGLMFIDRSVPGDASVVPFAQELGQVSSLGIRFPDAELTDATSTTPTRFALSPPPAGPIDLRLAVLSDFGSTSVVDLDDLTGLAWETPRIPGSATPRIFDIGDEFVVTSGTGNRVFSTSPGDVTDISDAVRIGPPFAAGPDGNGLWVRPEFDTAPVAQVLIATSADDRFSAEAVTAPDGAVLGDDGAGSIVFESGGAIYTGDGSATAQLTTGDLLAVSATAAIVRECDAQLVCAEFVVDRTSGERRPLDGAAGFALAVDPDRDASLVGSLSPDGRTALFSFREIDDDREVTETWAFVDLTSGDGPAPVGTPDDRQPVVWNDASTYAALVVDGRLVLYETATGSLIDVITVGDVAAIGRTDGFDLDPTN